MKHDIPHDLELPMARTVARKAAENYADRFSGFDFGHEWADDTQVDLSFTVAGKKLKGTLKILPTAFRFELQVPFLLQMFSGKAKELMERETQIWIDKAKNGELKDEGVASV